jgi:hypothetical protein
VILAILGLLAILGVLSLTRRRRRAEAGVKDLGEILKTLSDGIEQENARLRAELAKNAACRHCGGRSTTDSGLHCLSCGAPR